MSRCEHKHKQKIFLTGQTIKVQCKKDSKYIDENGRELCGSHFNRWFEKKYRKKYNEFMNSEI